MIKIVFHSGKILDQYGQPLIGAHIVADTKNPKGTISDFDGNFQIQGFVGELWEIGHLGKKSQMVTLKRGMPAATYILRDKGIQLDGVTVTAPRKKTWIGPTLAIVAAAFLARKIIKIKL